MNSSRDETHPGSHVNVASLFIRINLDDYLVYLYLSSFSVVYYFSSSLQLSKVIYTAYIYLPYYIYGLLNLFYVEFDKSIISRYSCNYTL